jgi:hypothetical protein
MHMRGIAEHTTVGTIVALDNQQWSIEDDAGRTVFVPLQQFTDATNLKIGDRVEIQPIAQGTVLRPFNWTIIRKLK